MAHIYTYDEIKKEFEDRDYILLTDHKLKCNEKYEYICKKHQDKGSQFIDWGIFIVAPMDVHFADEKSVMMQEEKIYQNITGKNWQKAKVLST